MKRFFSFFYMTFAIGFLIAALSLTGCALEPKTTSSLRFSLSRGPGPDLEVHYLLYKEGDTIAAQTPIDAAHAGGRTFGVITTNTETAPEYSVTFDAVENKRMKLRFHWRQVSGGQYYFDNFGSGPVDYERINTSVTVNDSPAAFDVLPGATIDVATIQIYP